MGVRTLKERKDWDDLLAERKNFHTPRKAWKELERDVDDMEVVVSVWKTKGGEIHIRSSQTDTLSAVGLLETAKLMYLDDMRTD